MAALHPTSPIIAVAKRTGVPLLVLLAAGVLLRVLAALAIWPAVTRFADSGHYVWMADGHMLAHPQHVAGYSMFLRVAHSMSAYIGFTTALQHLIGVATAVLLYALMRRLAAPRWAAVLAPAATLLAIDQVLIERALLTETLFSFLLTFFLYASVRSIESGQPVRIATKWVLLAGLALGFGAWVRPVAASLIPFFALWATWVSAGRHVQRLRSLTLAGGPAMALVVAYCLLNGLTQGYFGLHRDTNWFLYGRTAPFADCRKFDPPPGTAELCEEKPPDRRPAPGFYDFSSRSPAQKAFGEPPAGSEKVGAFARAAILNQPFDYAQAIVRDTARYFGLDWNGSRGLPLYDPAALQPSADDRRDRPVQDMGIATPAEAQREVERLLQAYYKGPSRPATRPGLLDQLVNLGSVMNVKPIVLLQAMILAMIGLFVSTGYIRATIVLLTGTVMLMLVVSVATAGWDARFTLPANGPAVAAGALGLWALATRTRGSPASL